MQPAFRPVIEWYEAIQCTRMDCFTAFADDGGSYSYRPL
jgi:hypothetical protein